MHAALRKFYTCPFKVHISSLQYENCCGASVNLLIDFNRAHSCDLLLNSLWQVLAPLEYWGYIKIRSYLYRLLTATG